MLLVAALVCTQTGPSHSLLSHYNEVGTTTCVPTAHLLLVLLYATYRFQKCNIYILFRLAFRLLVRRDIREKQCISRSRRI